MSKGIVIFGPAGAGKTTLGLMLASVLEFPYFDYDDYIWKKDTEEPFTERYPEEVKRNSLLSAILPNDYFVLSGYMDGRHEELDKMFILAVHVNASADLRTERIRKRDLDIYGKRVLPGGDMYETHERFIDSVSTYNDEREPFLKRHRDWAESLSCPVMYLDGKEPLIDNVQKIIEAYRRL